ncbi:alpha/beta fold hydrolase [Gilvimarinus sp. F26214L]|uniref:alpha/beta fold hydrolase n=1 Tax=Gilvimarinus sp. DZF01 TaxID=3461371 RepID=UPI00404565AD
MTIGGPVPLAGILTEPRKSNRDDLALLLLNSGIMHRVGACRLSVRVARAVASEAGIKALRFDFSGIGDSEPRRTGQVDFDRVAVDEVIEVMDYLQETRHVDRFVLYGLCSGALVACRAAEKDTRVMAVAQLDGCSYPTPRGYLRYYAKRVLSPRRWRKRLIRILGGSAENVSTNSVLTGRRVDFEVPDFARDPGKRQVTKQLQALMDRDVHLKCVFTGQEPYYCYPRQYRDCFSNVDFGERLSVDYYPNASHIFTQPVYQQQVVWDLSRWIASITAGSRQSP